MTDNLAHAIRRARWAKDAPRQYPEPPPAPVPSPPPQITALPPPLEPITPLPKPHSIEAIQRAVAAAYSIDVAALIGRRRNGKFMRPRQIGMYLCWELLPDVSQSQIGRRFQRDRTTVVYAIRRIEQMRRLNVGFDVGLQKMVDDIREIA